MINESLKEILNGCVSSKEEQLYKDGIYVKAINEYSRQCSEIRKHLPEEDAVSILDGLDIAGGEISKLEKNYFYKEGFKDGMNTILSFIYDKKI